MVFLGLLLSLVDVLIHALYAWFLDLIIVLHSLPNQLFLLGLLLSQYFRCCIHNNIFKSFPDFISSILVAIFQQYLTSLFLYNLVHFFNSWVFKFLGFYFWCFLPTLIFSSQYCASYIPF